MRLKIHRFGNCQSAPGPQSRCDPYRDTIRAKAAESLSAQQIYQDLIADGATVSYDSVRRYLRRIGHVRPLPFRRMECAAGEEAQVDFGTGAPIIGPDGKRRKTHVFRIVLCTAARATAKQRSPAWLRVSTSVCKKRLAISSRTPTWGKLSSDVPSATAILDRFMHHAEITAITGRSYRLRNQKARAEPAADPGADAPKPAIAPAGSGTKRKPKTTDAAAVETCQS